VLPVFQPVGRSTSQLLVLERLARESPPDRVETYGHRISKEQEDRHSPQFFFNAELRSYKSYVLEVRILQGEWGSFCLSADFAMTHNAPNSFLSGYPVGHREVPKGATPR
jgi:hypothetical protein